MKEQTALGSGGSRMLEQRIRAHGNFAEYTPIFLILLFISNVQGFPPLMIHAFGTIYIIARTSHIYAVVFYEKYDGEKLLTTTKYRVIGMVFTLLSITLLALINIITYITKAI